MVVWWWRWCGDGVVRVVVMVVWWWRWCADGVVVVVVSASSIS